MSHDYHGELPGFDPQQILVDGCHECERRSRWNDHGISSLDPERFAEAWLRARRWQSKALVRHAGGWATISDAEVPLLDTLSSVQIAQHRAWWIDYRTWWGIEVSS
jgi:hypothetical protein